MKPGSRSRPSRSTVARVARHIGRRDERADAAVLDQHGASVDQALIRQDAAIDQGGVHQMVSVILLRWGGRSGSNPRASERALTMRVEALGHQHGLKRGMRLERGQVAGACAPSIRRAMTSAPRRDELFRQRFHAGAGLVVLRKDQHGKAWLDQRHGAVPHFGGAERFGMKAAGFLEFQRRFLRQRRSPGRGRSRRDPARARNAARPRAPVERPGFSQQLGQRAQRLLQARHRRPGRDQIEQCAALAAR